MAVIIDGTNGIKSINGTAAAPSVTGTDTDTGIVYGTNTLSLATGGTTAVTVDSSQNVGIGTASPGAKLDVAGSMAGAAVTFSNFGSATTAVVGLGDGNTGLFRPAAQALGFTSNGVERMRINSSGNFVLAGQTGATATPQSISFSLDYSNSSVAAGCKLFFYNGTATDTYGLGVGADSDIQYHSGGVPTNNNGKHRFFVNNTEALRITPTGLLQFNSGYGSAATAYGCRAWVNFNGTGTVAIRASGNVSSITDNGTGDYTVNMTTAMPDANYSWGGTAKNADTGTLLCLLTGYLTQSTSAFRMRTTSEANGARDSIQVSVSVFR